MGKFEEIFGRRPKYICTAPGRTELSGNHTDHQHGCVLAAAVNLECRALVDKNDTGRINVYSEGYGMCTVDTADLGYREEEKNTTMSLIRGVAARIRELGGDIQGFDAYVTSSVLKGSGLSSSAAFEVLIGTIINRLYCDSRLTPVEIAQIGQWAENNYFGKPSGLMDQTASSVGNVITIDFADPAHPVVEKVEADFAKYGYALCIVDSGADHADLTFEYAAITGELARVCAVFGKQYLRDVDETEFYGRIAEVREAAGDRAVLRAIHVFNDNKRVAAQVAALKSDDFDTYLRLAAESGESSYMLLQNVIPTGATEHQEVAVALALSRHLLGGRGATRIQGGGFAGTIQAFVPLDMVDEYRTGIDRVLGEGSCHVLSIRAEGGTAEEC